MMRRRKFLFDLAAAGLSWTVLPSLLNSSLLAFADGQPGSKPSKKIFVLIFQRGAMDGLSMVPPLGDSHYANARPTIQLKKEGEGAALFLESGFYLHPSLSGLMKFWSDGNLAFVHQAGSPSASRSHFDAQDFVELGTPDEKNTPDGFLNRALRFNRHGDDSAVRAVALQATMPRILQGAYPAISMNSIRDYRIQSGVGTGDASHGFEEMYQQATDSVLRGVGHEIFDSLKSIQPLVKAKASDAYPQSAMAKHLREIAALIKAHVGLQVAVSDMGGWDTHVNQGNASGQLANRFQELSEALAAFAQDLGPLFQDVVVVTMTEFGRTVKENGNRGTDHGHGSVMMALGGAVQGKKVFGQYKDLIPANLVDGRDMPVTTDFRDVLGEVLQSHLGYSEIDKVFPGYSFLEKNKLKLIRT